MRNSQSAGGSIEREIARLTYPNRTRTQMETNGEACLANDCNVVNTQRIYTGEHCF